MSKIIIKKNQKKSKNQEKTNNNLPPTKNKTKIFTIKKLPFLQKITYTIIILNSLLSLFTLYYGNKIPWFTTGIKNFINIIKSIIPGGK